MRLMMYCTARYRWLTPAAVSLPAVLLPDAAGTGLGLDRYVQYLNTYMLLGSDLAALTEQHVCLAF